MNVGVVEYTFECPFEQLSLENEIVFVVVVSDNLEIPVVEPYNGFEVDIISFTDADDMYFELVVCDSVPVMRYEDDGVSAVVIPIIAEVGALEDRVCDSVSAVVEVSEAVISGVEVSCFSLVSSNTVEVGNELSLLSPVIVCSSEIGVDGVFDGVVIPGEVF